MANKKTGKNGARGKPGPGRPKGSPNKATRDVREAIAKLLQKNADNFGKWLKGVAEGEKETFTSTDEEGNEVKEESFVRRPDPGRALQLAMDMAEFHIPKLSRAEHVGDNGGAIKVEATVEFVTPPKRPAP